MDNVPAQDRESLDHACTRSLGPPKPRQPEVTLANFLIISQCLCLPSGIIVYILFARHQITNAPLSIDLIVILVSCTLVCLIGVQVLFARHMRRKG